MDLLRLHDKELVGKFRIPPPESFQETIWAIDGSTDMDDLFDGLVV